jgi:hypothetical protein
MSGGRMGRTLQVLDWLITVELGMEMDICNTPKLLMDILNLINRTFTLEVPFFMMIG